MWCFPFLILVLGHACRPYRALDLGFLSCIQGCQQLCDDELYQTGGLEDLSSSSLSLRMKSINSQILSEVQLSTCNLD